MIQFNRKVLLAKAETTYGSSSSPTSAANAILTSNLTITPIVANMIERNLDLPFLGNDIAIHDGVHVTVTFDVEMGGSGVAAADIADETDAPAWNELLKGCGFETTVTAATDISYALIDTGYASLTLAYNLNDNLHLITGARGSVSISMNVGELPKFSFSFTGIYNAPSKLSSGNMLLASVDHSKFVKPLAVNAVNTSTLTYNSSALAVENFSFDLANDVQYRSLAGDDQKVIITDRNPTGSISFEAPDDTSSWFSEVLAETPKELVIAHGTTSGNKFTLTFPKVQMTEPNYTESQKQGMISANLRFTYENGNDEMSVVFD